MSNTTIKTVLIDDEPRARETLREMLATFCPKFEIIGEGYDVDSGKKVIESSKPEVVFLDIRMPDGTGFDLLNKLKNLDFLLVFLTAYDEYALKAFKFSAIDYLLKPLDPEELINCCKKLSKTLQFEKKQFDVLIDNLDSQSKARQKIVLKTADTVHVVKVSDIIRIESDGNYTRFYIENRPAILVSKTLKEYDKILIDINFFRAHQSHLVNINRVVQINKQNGTTLIMDDGSQVPVSFRKKDLLFKMLHEL